MKLPLKTMIPTFGTNLAGDGKAIHSHGKPTKKGEGDRRRDEDADWGKKVSRGVDGDGNAWEKIKSWFGFRIHLMVDADVELAYSLQGNASIKGRATCHAGANSRAEHGSS